MSGFRDFEAAITKAIDDGIIPGAVVVAKDKSGQSRALPCHRNL